jgi:hypothetical protein
VTPSPLSSPQKSQIPDPKSLVFPGIVPFPELLGRRFGRLMEWIPRGSDFPHTFHTPDDLDAFGDVLWGQCDLFKLHPGKRAEILDFGLLDLE